MTLYSVFNLQSHQFSPMPTPFPGDFCRVKRSILCYLFST